jgi:hypothetical protein
VTCADLFTPSAASAQVGARVTLRSDETSTPATLADIATRQAGILSCNWSSPPTSEKPSDEPTDNALSVFIEPDGATDFAKNIDGLKSSDSDTPNVGDSAAVDCTPGTSFECRANMLVHDYWVTVELHGQGSTKVSKSLVLGRTTAVLTTAATALAAADPAAAAWTPPAGSASTFCDPENEKSALATVRKIFATPELRVEYQGPGSAPDVSNIAAAGENFAHCSWAAADPIAADKAGTEGDTYLAILAGGAWAVPGLVASPPAGHDIGTWSVITIPGSDGAVQACDKTNCDAIFSVGPNAAELVFTNRGTTRNTAELTAMVAAVAAS